MRQPKPLYRSCAVSLRQADLRFALAAPAGAAKVEPNRALLQISMQWRGAVGLTRHFFAGEFDRRDFVLGQQLQSRQVLVRREALKRLEIVDVAVYWACRSVVSAAGNGRPWRLRTIL